MQAQKPATSGEAIAAQKGESVLMVSPTTLFDRMTEIYQQIENRALRFFEESGYRFGNDLDNWLRAEAELLLKVPFDISDSDTQLTVRASIPDFKEKEIQVSVEPFRLLIYGNQESQTTPTEGTVSEAEVKQLFCSVDLPQEVTPSAAKTEFKDGFLTVTLTKVTASEEKK